MKNTKYEYTVVIYWSVGDNGVISDFVKEGQMFW